MSNTDTGNYTLIAVYHIRIDGKLCVTNPKGLMGMNKDKADGAIKWWKRIMATKDYPCFYYDPLEETIFNEKDDGLNEEKVIEMIKRFNGFVPGDKDDPFKLN